MLSLKNVFLCLSLLLVFACKKKEGEVALPGPPVTTLMVDTINVSGNNRLITKVKLSWSGTSKNGYVTGYKILFGYKPLIDPKTSLLAVNSITTRTDSVFRFAITPTDSNIYFYVQAIDNNNQADPKPAHLRIPLKNSPPTLAINQDDILKSADTIFAALSFSWTGSDIDGEDTWRVAEIKANNGDWVTIPKSAGFLTLIAENPGRVGVGNALIYQGQNAALLTTGINGTGSAIKLPGWIVGDTNRIYMRSRDISNAVSKIDRTIKAYYTKQVKSGVLVINARPANSPSDPDYLSLFTTALQSALPNGYDWLEFAGFGGKYQPLYPTAYMQVLLPAYNKVVYFGDNNPRINIRVKDTTQGIRPLLIEAFAPGLDNYKRNGGKLFIVNRLPGHQDVNRPALSSPMYTLLPITPLSVYDSLKFRSGPNDTLKAANNSGYPDLRNVGRTITGVEVFTINGNAEPLYRLSPLAPNRDPNYPESLKPYTGTNLIGLRQRAENGKVNMVYLAPRLEFYTQNNGLNTLFNKVLNEDLNW